MNQILTPAKQGSAITAPPYPAETKTDSRPKSSFMIAHLKEVRQRAIRDDARLRHLTGFERVGLMIAEREEQLEPQYMPEEWAREKEIQQLRAVSLLREHSFDGQFPDFETELSCGRVIFSVDEVIVAAARFEAQGRATPAPESNAAD